MQLHLESVQHNDAVIDPEYPYITSITLKNKNAFSCIVDNTYAKTICVYHLDPYDKDPNIAQIVSITTDWFNEGCSIPISVIFERSGLKPKTSLVCRTYNISNIAEIDGPVYSFFDKPLTIKKQQIRVEKR